MTYAAASHQGAIEKVWLHFSGAVIPSIFMFTVWTKGQIHPRNHVAINQPGSRQLEEHFDTFWHSWHVFTSLINMKIV